MTARLETLLDALAPCLTELVIRTRAVSVELELGGRRLRLEHQLEEGEHDLSGAADRLLYDALGLVAMMRGGS